MPDQPTHRRRSSRLSRETILDAATVLLDEGSHEFSLRELGAALGVHNTAFYRYFRDKNQLLLAAADLILTGVADSAEGTEEPFEAVAQVCRALRTALLARPAAGRVLAQGPARQPNELQFTEKVLALLCRAGLSAEQTVDAYHALVEFTVGSSVIDQPLASLPVPEREGIYRKWRADYLGLDRAEFPHLVELAPTMYQGSTSQFEFGLLLMISSLRAMAETGSQS